MSTEQTALDYTQRLEREVLYLRHILEILNNYGEELSEEKMRIVRVIADALKKITSNALSVRF